MDMDPRREKLKRGLALFVVALFLFAASPFISNRGAQAAAAWFDASWRYRRPVTVDNQNATALADYQAHVTLNASNFDFASAKPDGADIRFTSVDGTTLLSHWTESYDSAGRTASLWVKVPSLPAASSTTIYLYYGNAGAASTSSADSTFLFYDGFNAAGPPVHLNSFSRVGVAMPPGPAGSWDERVRERMSVVYDASSGTYKAWYCGHTVAGGEASSDIGYATSPDGVTWTKYAGNPVISRPQQDQDPCVLKVGGTYYMYIEVTPGYPHLYTDLFTSPDGVTWTASPSNPVKADAATPLVWAEGGNWYMLYENYATTTQQDIYLATSSDGVNWVDSPSNPVIQADAGKDVCPDSIIKQNGTYHLYYHGNSLPRNLHSTSTDLVNWSAGVTLFPRYYESFWVIPHGSEFWAYAWDVSAYGSTENGGVANSGYHLFKGYDSTTGPDPAKWDEVQKGHSTRVDFNGAWAGLPPFEDDTTASSVSLESKATFTSDVVIELRRELIGSSYADVSLGSGDVVDVSTGGSTDWWHTTLQSGYLWYFDRIGYSTSELRKMPASGGSSSLSAPPFDPGTNIQTNFEVHRLVYAADGALYWYVDGALKAQASDSDFLNGAKKLLISQGQYANDQFSGESEIDWVRVRKYAPIEPTAAVGARQSRPVTPTGSTFYFAEGYTGPLFQEYLCIGNPEAASATADVDYIFSDGSSEAFSYAVPAGSRITVNVNEQVGANREVSMRVTSRTTGLVAERPMYFDYHGQWTGGHDVIGAAAPARRWYFAEGTTINGFDEWVTVLNPGTSAAGLTFRYLVEGAGETDISGTVPAKTRATFSTADQIGHGKNAGLILESDRAVVAERPMYFDYMGLANNGWTGGSDVVGAGAPARQWLFAEGTTRVGFEEWLTLLNPTQSPIAVTATYLFPGGDAVAQTYDVPTGERVTVSVNQELGPGQDNSVMLSCDSPFLAERPMYFNYQGQWTGGHDVIGAPAADTAWVFAEGYTGAGFNEWLTILNPGAGPATVDVTYLPQSGAPISRQHTVSPGSRYTIDVNSDAGGGLTISARVRSDVPVVVERPMYFDFNSAWTGGHDVVGLVPGT